MGKDLRLVILLVDVLAGHSSEHGRRDVAFAPAWAGAGVRLSKSTN